MGEVDGQFAFAKHINGSMKAGLRDLRKVRAEHGKKVEKDRNDAADKMVARQRDELVFT